MGGGGGGGDFQMVDDPLPTQMIAYMDNLTLSTTKEPNGCRGKDITYHAASCTDMWPGLLCCWPWPGCTRYIMWNPVDFLWITPHHNVLPFTLMTIMMMVSPDVWKYLNILRQNEITTNMFDAKLHENYFAAEKIPVGLFSLKKFVEGTWN